MTILVIGEVLLDHFPDYQRVGGAPLNFACHLKKLGLAVRLITRIGADADGRRIRRLLERYGFNPTDLQTDPVLRTGAVNVALDTAGVPTFDILSDVAYDRLQLEQIPESPATDLPRLLYYGALIQRSPNGFEQVGRFLRRRPPGTKCFCDINLRPPHYSRETVTQSLQYADILKLNDQELEDIRKLFGHPVPAEAFAEYLLSRFGIEMLAITRGADGSTLMTAHERIVTSPSKIDAVVDTVGAGDGFAAILAYGILQAQPLETIARAANDFAAEICQQPGAVVADDAFYRTWKSKLGGKP